MSSEVVFGEGALADQIQAALAQAWDEGYEAGGRDAVFDERGLSTDSDAGEHPHVNPYL